MSASGGAVSAPAPIPSCTPPSIPPFQPLSQPQSTNPFTSAMSWGAPTRDGTPQQPPQQQYQYQEAEERYDEEDEGWVPAAPHQPWNRGRGPPRRAQQSQPPQGQQGYNDHHFTPWEYDDSSPIYIPENVESQVEIRPQLLGILPEFRGYKQDDPYNHLYEFIVIANANTPRNTNRNIFRLRLFPFTLKDKAKYWFTSLPSNSITIWDQLKARFLQEFYPASKTTEIRRAIQDFQQKPREAFHEAWDRLKELMRLCPHHDIPKWQLVKVFFDGASETNQAMINASSSGTIMMQDPEEAWQFLEQLSNGSKANFSTRKTVGTAVAVGADADWKKDVRKEISKLNKKFDRLVSTLQNGPQSQPQGGQGGPKTQEANQVYGQGQGQLRMDDPIDHITKGSRISITRGGSGNNNNNRGPNTSSNNAPGTQEDLVTKMYEMFNATQQQSQANAKAIANMEKQIGQLAENQRKSDNGKLPSTTEINLTHGSEAELEKEEQVKEEIEIKEENKEEMEEKEIPVEKEPHREKDKDVQEEKQSTIAEIKQRKKEKKGRKRQKVPESTGPSINQPLWDELKNTPDDTRILQEMCDKNGKSKTPTPDTVRLTIKASEALLGTLPKKEKDPRSPLIIATVGDVVNRNTLFDLGASVNVLPRYLYDKYKNEELEPANTILQLVDQSTKVSHGKLTNVIVKVGDFLYPVDFLVMEYESLEDAPALILGRPFLATAGVVIDCKTGDLDIFFGTRKRRLNMFGSPISLPQGYDDKELDSNMLMEPGIRDKSKIWTRTGEGGKEEVLKKTKEHPLSTIDKEQLLDMMEMLEARHQQYEKDAREREAKVFKLLEAQQQWISGVSDRMTQLTSLISMMAQNFMPDFKKPPLGIQEE
ncbi:hypothetical protein L1887_17859 [Cichorium endivia]|nr:hypothetical protein L1887_17859 [Cichorium endivia]